MARVTSSSAVVDIRIRWLGELEVRRSEGFLSWVDAPKAETEMVATFGIGKIFPTITPKIEQLANSAESHVLQSQEFVSKLFSLKITIFKNKSTNEFFEVV